MSEALVDVKEITLPVHGREMTFSKEDLIAILEQHFKKETKAEIIEVAQTPTDGKCFEVKPKSINQERFQEMRRNPKQERTRRMILDAFTEVKYNPEKYAKTFKTMRPKKTYAGYTLGPMKLWAKNVGGHITDWVEQALEWAQRIDNGEEWAAICNYTDPSDWYRLIRWQDGDYRLVGGSIVARNYLPASAIHSLDYYSIDPLVCTVLSVTIE